MSALAKKGPKFNIKGMARIKNVRHITDPKEETGLGGKCSKYTLKQMPRKKETSPEPVR